MTFLRGAGFPWHPLNLLKSLSCSATTLQKYRLRVLFFLFLLAGSSSDVRLKTRLAIRDPSGLFTRDKTLDKKRPKNALFLIPYSLHDIGGRKNPQTTTRKYVKYGTRVRWKKAPRRGHAWSPHDRTSLKFFPRPPAHALIVSGRSVTKSSSNPRKRTSSLVDAAIRL